MDHEHEQLSDHSPARPVERDRPSPEAGLPSQIGNRAFTSLIQRSGKSQGAGPLDPEIAGEIKAEKGGGRPLDDATRTDMEGHLGTDLSGVRVHTGGSADHLNRSVQAEAFTTGNDVFFKDGKYAPDTSAGRGLLAHELTHVVQQRSGQVNGGGQVSHPDDAHEVEAKSVGDAVASAPTGVQRREDEGEEELQMSADADAVQREGMEEEEELQMSADADAVQREGMEEEEELQMSADADAVQRREDEGEEEEALQG